MKHVQIGNKIIGENKPTYIVAEIGINHNGDMVLAKKMIDIAVNAGCDAVKFQKRTIDLVYSKEELDKSRESPWGNTNRMQKEGLELDEDQYTEIDSYCKEKSIHWFASCWDRKSVDFIELFNPPCYKIPSALLTNHKLLYHIKSKCRPIILSTGMSSIPEIKKAVKVLGEDDLVILHCTSTYPTIVDELNLDVILSLRRMFDVPIGYSGHETGVLPSVVAVSLGACMVERHITIDRTLYGSDQPASLEPKGLKTLVRDIRLLPVIRGDGIKRVYDSEIPIKQKLRRGAEQYD
jgi:N-acetylneuraminate synthase